jgi:hypothetical protein
MKPLIVASLLLLAFSSCRTVTAPAEPTPKQTLAGYWVSNDVTPKTVIIFTNSKSECFMPTWWGYTGLAIHSDTVIVANFFWLTQRGDSLFGVQNISDTAFIPVTFYRVQQ